jgi:putative heme-binding domain-containing protein
MMKHPLSGLAAFSLIVSASVMGAAAEEPLKLKRGDHLCILGNTLAERMQHDGWFETLLHDRFPEHALVVRNQAFSADAITRWFGDEPPARLRGSDQPPEGVTTRLRSAGFGSADDWLKFGQADVIFAFFGFNESFGGETDVKRFKQALVRFIRHTLGQTYHGKTPPRLVLFSPIAHEDLGKPNLPDGRENNQRLALYTQAMAEVASAHGVLLVDLFEPSRRLHEQSERPLTINGIHLNSDGNRQMASVMDRALWPTRNQPIDWPRLEKLRQAVLDKNFYWFHRYRTTDGYNVYGGRSHLKFRPDITNRTVMQREMAMLDTMTANRDRRLWAVAQGMELEVDDSNLPEVIPVPTNLPGPGPDGEHLFLTGEGAIEKMTTPAGMQVHLFASEEQFPELVNPVQMAWDTRGRLWVAVWPTYPHWNPREPMNDKLLIFEDTDGDRRADRCTVFADGLNNPTGFEFYGAGVMLAQVPDLVFLQDTDGDDQADVRRRVLHGLGSADTHHSANSFTLSPGGALFFQEGTFHRTQTETPYGPVRNVDACGWRFEPRTWKFQRYIPFNFANPHGHVFDRWGQDIITDGTGAQPYHGTLFSGHVDYPSKHPKPPQLYQQRTRPCPATEILSSRHFPAENQGNFLVENVIGFQGILQYHFEDRDSSLSAVEVEPILQSTDPNFRPSDLEIGPDGALYVLDWHNQIIGHMQHHIRDPNRDAQHGRIYTVTCQDRPLLKPRPIAGEPLDALLELLEEPEDRLRYRAKIELSSRPTGEVIAAVNGWVDRLDLHDPEHAHHLLEALWVHQFHHTINVGLLERVLSSEDFRARAAATRMVGNWPELLAAAGTGPLTLLRRSIADPHPRVRLEAIRACSFLPSAEAAEVALEALGQPMDKALEYTLTQTVRQLERFYLPRLQAGGPFAQNNPLGFQRVLQRLATPSLLALPRSAPVCLATVLRPDISAERREEALAKLVRIKQSDPLTELLAILIRADRTPRDQSNGVLTELAGMITGIVTGRDPDALASQRQELAALATTARKPIVRQIGMVALLAMKGEPNRCVEDVWKLAASSPTRLVDLLEAVPLVTDRSLQPALYTRIRPLLERLPPDMVEGSPAAATLHRAAIDAITYLPGHDRDTFFQLARLYREGIAPAATVRAIARLRQDQLPEDEVLALAQQIVARVGQTSADKRTSPTMLATIQLGKALARRLPPKAAEPIRQVLRDLGVEIVTIRPVPRMIRFDRSELAVEAGKPVQIVFENIDVMQHNFVLMQPGTYDQVVLATLKLQMNLLQALARDFVPESPHILQATRLLQAGQTARLQFTAPAKPGDYPYVCTYPGHLKTMRGVLHVVPNLEDYLVRHRLPDPETSLATRTQVVKDYTYQDLAAQMQWAAGSRSYHKGKRLFTELTCTKCHKIDGPGDLVGPSLARADLQLTRTELLQSIIDPSRKIDPKYQMWVMIAGGKPVTGMILKESADRYLLNEQPGEACRPTVVFKDDLDEQPAPSALSVMPAKVLNTMTGAEIQDLLAFVHAKGDPQHRWFTGYQETGRQEVEQKKVDASGKHPWVVYTPAPQEERKLPGAGKRVVLISGDEEYRSEETLPQLGHILARHHGFHCTVLFAIDPENGTINPLVTDNIPGLEALERADLMVIFTRFRDLPDNQMQHIVRYIESGRPVVGLRTATHAFQFPKAATYEKWSWNYQGEDFRQGFGRKVLGETWISHHGHHGHQSTRGIIVPAQGRHPIVRGIKDGLIWGPTDVYGVRLPLPDTCQPLVLGQVLRGMRPSDPPVEGAKNQPMMPIAWTNRPAVAPGKQARVFTTTMGAAQDFSSEGLRRLLVNACYWSVGLQESIPKKARVDLVGKYEPTPFGFGKHKKGVRPADFK